MAKKGCRFFLGVALLWPPAVCLAQVAPSQRELNGFVLGQHRRVVENQFGEPVQETRTPDGWRYAVYVADATHRAYMVFKFPRERSDYMVSIQLAGERGTPMVPFHDVLLGDSVSLVRQYIGPPWVIDTAPDVPLERWTYADRNYSFEFDSTGSLYSIQIFGFDGFPQEPLTPLPLLSQLRTALLERDVDWLMELLAPDVEIYAPGGTYAFERAARVELSDSTTDIRRLLLAEHSSVRAALADAAIVDGADVVLRVFERQRPGRFYAVWQLPDGSAIQEIVFEAFAGQWRAWEVRFRR